MITKAMRRYEIVGTVGYDFLFRFLSLGLGTRLHRYVAERAPLQPGSRVVDLGCGTGLLHPAVVERIGATGTLVGVDLSARMLQRAERRRARHGWTNVELRHGDASEPAGVEEFDVAVFCLSLSTLPDPVSAVHGAAKCLAPGGTLVVFDALVDPALGVPALSRAYIRTKAPFVGSNPRAPILEAARDAFSDVRFETPFGGLYTFLTATGR